MKMLDQYPDVEQEIRAAFKWPVRLCVAVGLVCLLAAACMALQGCSTRSIVITDGMVSATSATLLYCPEATVTRVVHGNRAVDTSGIETGVGDTLKGVADVIFGGGR